MQPRRWIHSRSAFRAALVLATCTAAQSQPARLDPTTNSGQYEFRSEHDPDGIAKFFMGREIAHVMGHQAADWLERPEREKEEHASKMREALKLKPGMVVADVG